MDGPVAGNQRVNRYKRQIVVAWWLALIATTTASLMPNMGPPTTPLLGLGMDKIIHLATYFVLAAVPALFFRSGGPIIRSVLLVAAMSIGIEFAQDLVPGRLFSMGDVIANMLGVLPGLVIGLYSRRYRLEYFC